MSENCYVIRFADGAYMTIESDEKPDRGERLIWKEGDHYYGASPGNWQIAYGPATLSEAQQFLADISGYTDTTIDL